MPHCEREVPSSTEELNWSVILLTVLVFLVKTQTIDKMQLRWDLPKGGLITDQHLPNVFSLFCILLRNLRISCFTPFILFLPPGTPLCLRCVSCSLTRDPQNIRRILLSRDVKKRTLHYATEYKKPISNSTPACLNTFVSSSSYYKPSAHRWLRFL